MKLTIDDIAIKVNELILKHNDLAGAVVEIAESVKLINEAVFSKGEIPKNLDS
jgi:hypothetical protein